MFLFYSVSNLVDLIIASTANKICSCFSLGKDKMSLKRFNISGFLKRFASSFSPNKYPTEVFKSFAIFLAVSILGIARSSRAMRGWFILQKIKGYKPFVSEVSTSINISNESF